MTGNPHLQQAVFRMAEERSCRRRIERLASALEAAFQIPPGTHLIWVLGDGTERNNREALETWAKHEVRRIQSEAVEQCMPQLSARLHRTLTQWENDRGIAP
ncbi:hypothetical protein [Thioalkalivibrio sp. ALE11]|uniref:hypothetical protein n=1 Tax=Thioalkalivibrio sp. ALE11 TaxID=1265494 RepID=UPI00056EA410|nr:hypothetical protein [Thioalkalivibrio sp. ALE11]